MPLPAQPMESTLVTSLETFWLLKPLVIPIRMKLLVQFIVLEPITILTVDLHQATVEEDDWKDEKGFIFKCYMLPFYSFINMT